MKKIYKDYGIAFFNNFAEKQPLAEVNRKNIEEILDRIITGHINATEKYGESEALDNIFIKEVKKFYSAIFRENIEIIGKMIDEVSDRKNLKGYSKEIEECAIIYPSFNHEETEDGGLAHSPSADFYILNKLSYTKANTDDEDNCIENFPINEINNCNKIAYLWTKNKNANEKEFFLIANEIFQIFNENEKSANKKDIINYLAKEVDKNLLRFL